jgi:hypothetical protein
VLLAALGGAGGSGSGSGLSSGSVGNEPHVELAARGGCVEALLPDVGGAHGVATSVHLFPPARLERTGLFGR